MQQTDGSPPREAGPAFRSGGFTDAPVEIARIDPPAPECFERDYRRPGHPVVMRGLVSERDLSRWSLHRLRAECSELRVPAHRTRAGSVIADPRLGVTTEPTPLGNVLAQFGGGVPPSLYVMARFEELPAEWRERISTPAYCEGAAWLARKLWLSPTGTVSMMHRDIADNIHVQLIGSKRFTLVDAREGARLYPNSLLSSLPNGCRADVEAPDFERFPRLRTVHRAQVELVPGDGLFIPRGTWHHVRTVADSLSANFWWARGVWFLAAAGADLFKRLRGVSR